MNSVMFAFSVDDILTTCCALLSMLSRKYNRINIAAMAATTIIRLRFLEEGKARLLLPPSPRGEALRGSTVVFPATGDALANRRRRRVCCMILLLLCLVGVGESCRLGTPSPL